MSLEGFSAAQIAHAQATTLDYYLKDGLFDSSIQDKPTLSKFEGKSKSYPGGKESISIGVKMANGAGGTNDTVQGFSHTDTVDFYNPANGLRAEFVWREHHIGMTMSETQLKTQGILVTDTDREVRGSGDRGAFMLANILDDATKDFAEQQADGMNNLIWGDGTADTSALAGLRSIISDIPTLGTVGGLSAVTYPLWRNYAFTAAFAADGSFDANYGGGAITSSPTNGGTLIQELQKLWRQLKRRGGKPDCIMAGADWIDAYEKEIRANGTYSDIGFTQKQDGAMGDMQFMRVPVVYDPTLDDLGREKFAYIWDSSDIKLYTLEGDWKRRRTPKRPFNQFVFHQSLLCTGQMTVRRRNSAAVVEIA